LLLDRSILDRIGVDEDTPLEISIVGDAILVTPIRDTERQKQFETALESANERYGDAFKRLAQ
jgi:hypothetical protein